MEEFLEFKKSIQDKIKNSPSFDLQMYSYMLGLCNMYEENNTDISMDGLKEYLENFKSGTPEHYMYYGSCMNIEIDNFMNSFEIDR